MNRILFVDDEPHFLDGLRRALRNHSEVWDMTFVTSVNAALEHMREFAPDTVVTDLQMSGMGGFDLLKALRDSNETRDIPVILLTGVEDRDLKSRALELGATDLLNKPMDRSDLIARIRSALRLKHYQDELKALNASLEHKVSERTAELAASRLDIILRLAKAAEYRDKETGSHIVRVGCYCRAFAEALGMKSEFVRTILLTAPLHDIGKIGIPDRILLKPGKLTTHERQVMQQHSAMGAKILLENPTYAKPFLEWLDIAADRKEHKSEQPLLKMAASIALGHHERWDGTGYPHGLAGEEIPVECRIVALADTYDALRSERPYKPAYSEEQTRNILREETGSHFDPVVVAAFERSLDEVREIRRQFSDERELVVSEAGSNK